MPKKVKLVINGKVELDDDLDNYQQVTDPGKPLLFAVTEKYTGNSICRDVWYNNAWHHI